MAEDLLIRWTVRLSMLCYLVFLWLSAGRSSRPTRRVWWTAGVVLMVAHVVVTFQFAHQWSHASAVADTARQTRELMGWEFGQGVYFNYLFVAIWVVDAIWWWVAPGRYAGRRQWLSSIVHCYLLFIVVNACIVFESGVTRWAALLAIAMLLARMAAHRHVGPEPTA